MKHMIKIGTQYLTAGGTFSEFKADALIIYNKPRGTAAPRWVKLVPAGTLHRSPVQAEADYDDTAGPRTVVPV